MHTLLIHVAIFTNNVSIEPSKDRPTAGEVFTLTCTVFSDGPPVIEWIGEGIGSEGVTVYSQSVNGLNSTMVLEFQPLRTSHGGTYTCISSARRSPSAHDSKLDYVVEVYSKLIDSLLALDNHTFIIVQSQHQV